MKKHTDLLWRIKNFKHTRTILFIIGTIALASAATAGGYFLYTNVIDKKAEEAPEDLVVSFDDAEGQRLAMSGYSIQKDLTLSIRDENDNLCTDKNLTVYVSEYKGDEVKTDSKKTDSTDKKDTDTKKKDVSEIADVEDAMISVNESNIEIDTDGSVSCKGTAYSDTDNDGIIYIDGLKAGNYLVSLAPVEGFDIAQANGVFQVTGEVEYKVVDVKDKVKKETEINVKVEDTEEKPKEEGSSTGPKDTVELVNSAAQGISVSKSYVKTPSTTKPTSGLTAGVNTVKADTGTVSITKAAGVYYNVNEANTAQIYLAAAGITITDGITYTSANPAVATVSSTGLVTGVSQGATTITAAVPYTYTDANGAQATGSTTITCQVNSVGYSSDGVLYATNGLVLYKDQACTTVATEADYYTQNTFYTVYRTGWQTIDGNVYYYTKEGVPVTGNQVIGGVQYSFDSQGKRTSGVGGRGIDVSKYQGTINWAQVAASGVTFAIIRCGYRGASTGALVQDPYYAQNMSGATKAGIKVGTYFFTQAVNLAEAVEEASMAVGLARGYSLAYPIYIDTESASGGRANGLDKNTRTLCIKAFCMTVANSGYKAGIYASTNWYGSKLDMSQLGGYSIWVAQYSDTCTYKGNYSMWQYTSKGSVPGISGNVDMNLAR